MFYRLTQINRKHPVKKHNKQFKTKLYPLAFETNDSLGSFIKINYLITDKVTKGGVCKLN